MTADKWVCKYIGDYGIPVYLISNSKPPARGGYRGVEVDRSGYRCFQVNGGGCSGVQVCRGGDRGVLSVLSTFTT